MKFTLEEKRALIKALRQGLFLILLIGISYFMHLSAHFYKNETFAENGIIENFQFFILFLGAIIFFIRAHTSNEIKNICFLCAAMCLLACFREQDKTLDECLPVLSWKLGFLFPLLAIGYSLKHFKKTIKEMVVIVNSPVFIMCCCAIILICPAGQLIGHKPFVQDVLNTQDVARIKEFVEEAVETIGYFLIFLAGVESFFIKPSKKTN